MVEQVVLMEYEKSTEEAGGLERVQGGQVLDSRSAVVIEYVTSYYFSWFSPFGRRREEHIGGKSLRF